MVEQLLTRAAGRAEWNGIDRLGLRVAEMINSPIAQLRRTVCVHRLDTDSEEAWETVLGILRETDGLDMTVNDDGAIELRWRILSEEARTSTLE